VPSGETRSEEPMTELSWPKASNSATQAHLLKRPSLEVVLISRVAQPGSSKSGDPDTTTWSSLRSQ
jgi:hypothetical protein